MEILILIYILSFMYSYLWRDIIRKNTSNEYHSDNGLLILCAIPFLNQLIAMMFITQLDKNLLKEESLKGYKKYCNDNKNL